MPTAVEHQEKAESHLRFLSQIGDEFPDWLATVAFYAAVEFVEKLLAKHDHHSDDHSGRKRMLKRFYPNRQVNEAYNQLYNASMDARYSPLSECPSVKEVRETLIGKRLKHIQQYVAAHAS